MPGLLQAKQKSYNDNKKTKTPENENTTEESNEESNEETNNEPKEESNDGPNKKQELLPLPPLPLLKVRQQEGTTLPREISMPSLGAETVARKSTLFKDTGIPYTDTMDGSAEKEEWSIIGMITLMWKSII